MAARKPRRTQWIYSEDLRRGDVILSGGPPSEILDDPAETSHSRWGLALRMRVRDLATGDVREILFPYESGVQIQARAGRDEERPRHVRLTDTQRSVLRLIATDRNLGEYVPAYRGRRGRGAFPATIASRAAMQLRKLGLVEAAPERESHHRLTERGARLLRGF